MKNILEDGQAFVAQTKAELASTKTEMAQQLEAVHSQQQAFRTFVDGFPRTEVVDALKTKLEAIDHWCRVNSLDTVPVTVMELGKRLDTLTGQVDIHVTKLMQDVATTRSVVGNLEFASNTGGGSGKGAAPRDRNVFDPRDYKVEPLGDKPSLGKWKQWVRDFECFVDTIGPSWKRTSGLLRQLRFREQPFDASQLEEANRDSRKRNDKAPAGDEFEYEFATKTDILYRLIMPKLDVVMSAEFSQSGDESGFELFRQLSRKIDPPRVDVKFDL